MAVQFVKNKQGRVIGQIHFLQNGIKQIRNSSGLLLGWYDPVSDKTIDAKTGNWFGYGDQIMGLLH